MLDLSRLKPGLTGRAEVVVTDTHLAPHVGSGRAPVFASPSMVALMEAAAVDCVEGLLPEGFQSLGTHLDVTHRSPTPKGLAVTATAELIKAEGRVLTFRVEARDIVEIIGTGTHTRVVVDDRRFLAKVNSKAPAHGAA
jgi:predicted thioesterase